MKKYKQFIKEEAEIRDTSGLPEDWVDKTDRKAQGELGVRKDQVDHRIMGRLMQVIGRSQQLLNSVGSIDEVGPKLSALAIDVIDEEFPGLLDSIKTDVELVRQGTVGDEVDFDDVPKEPKDESEMEDELSGDMGEEEREELASKLDSGELKSEVDKAKLMNLVQQGEGLNTKKLLDSEVSRNGLREIFGENADELIDLYRELTQTMIKVNWMIPVEGGADMMSGNKGSLSGACSVEKDDEETDGEETDGEETDSQDENDSGLTIKVRGIDYPMLLHELVKGIYMAISIGGFSVIEDDDMKKAAKMATSSFRDEAEDFRYGPYIASELRDFINSCEGSGDIDGVRAYVFGMMVQMPAPEFLELMLGIFEKTDKAKETIESFIRDIKQSFDDYNRQEVEYNLDNQGEDNQPEEDTPAGFDEEPEVDELEQIRKKNTEPRGYDKMNREELNDVLNQLLDDENYAEIEKLKEYLPK